VRSAFVLGLSFHLRDETFHAVVVVFSLLTFIVYLWQAVKLESVHPTRIRYLVIVSRMGKRGEESCLLGIDCNERTTVGLVLKVMADTAIRLDGDG
jgi:protein phosphatase slingshot